MGLLSVQFSFSVMTNSLQPHGLQHARLPCPAKMSPVAAASPGPEHRSPEQAGGIHSCEGCSSTLLPFQFICATALCTCEVSPWQLQGPSLVPLKHLSKHEGVGERGVFWSSVELHEESSPSLWSPHITVNQPSLVTPLPQARSSILGERVVIPSQMPAESLRSVRKHSPDRFYAWRLLPITMMAPDYWR